jgi:hypothetical protein
MIVKDRTQSTKFKPIRIDITIESRNELLVLWARMNASLYDIKKANEDHLEIQDLKIDDNELFHLLDKRL